MANCDTCAAETTWEIGTAYTPDEFRELVNRGYIAEDTIKQFPASFSREHAIAQWKQGLVAQSQTPWLLCPRCAKEAGKYMTKEAGTGPPPGVPISEPITPAMLKSYGAEKSGCFGLLFVSSVLLIAIVLFWF